MIDLHLHSTYSDGKISIEKLVKEVQASKIKYCSLTDHDNIGGLEKMKSLIEEQSINFINGVEFSVLYKQQEIHILMYDFDIKEIKEILKERNKIIKELRKKELAQSINLFKKEGFKVSNNFNLSDEKPIGLLVALDVYNKKQNQKTIIERHGYLLNEKEFYDYYQAPGKSCYVIKSGIDLNWFLTKTKKIKGDKILAHPFVPVSFLVKPLTISDVDYLINKGLNGVEVYHDRNTDDQINILKRYVNKKSLLFTGGSDYHGKKDNTSIGFYGNDRKIPAFKLTNYQL